MVAERATIHGKNTRVGERGYVLFIVMMILALIGAIISATSMHDATASSSLYAIATSSDNFHESEAGIGHAVAWLRANGQSLVYPFRRENFYNSFTRTAPSAGANDTGVNSVLTKVKIQGTSDSAILLNDVSLATTNFPTTENVSTGTVFNATSEFSASVLGEASIRVTLIDAIAEDPSKDYGSSPNPIPETDFFPVYRVDAISSGSGASHVYAIVLGETVNYFDSALYGQDSVTLEQTCDAYDSSLGAYSGLNKSANCNVYSTGAISVANAKTIYGSATSNDSISGTGTICEDFIGGCPHVGPTCANAACSVGAMPSYSAWALYCSSTQGDLTVSSNTSLQVTSDSPADRCWDTVTINPGVTLELTTSEYPYYFQNIVFVDASTSKLVADPSSPGSVRLYAQSISGNTFNGNNINADSAPTELQLYYVGTNALTINGSVDIEAAIVSANAGVTLADSFSFYGALAAESINANSSGAIHYDTALADSGDAVDMRFQIKSIVPYYN